MVEWRIPDTREKAKLAWIKSEIQNAIRPLRPGVVA